MKAPRVEDVLAEHGAMLFRIAGGYATPHLPRDELAQDMSVAVWKALPGYRGGDLRAFVARVAQFAALDCLRRKTIDVEGDADEGNLESPAIRPDQYADATQKQMRLLAAVRRLPIGRRECVLLVLEGFDHGEIAGILGIAVNTVDQRLSRARRQLRELLEVDHA